MREMFSDMPFMYGLLPFVKVVDNFDAEYEYITNEGTLFTFKTNLKSPRYKLITIDFSKPEMLTSNMASEICYPFVQRDESAVNDYHGTKIYDPYVWLEDPDSEGTKAFVEQQNAITMPYLAACETRENFKNRYDRIPYRVSNGYPKSVLRLHKLTGERLMTFPLDIGSIVGYSGKKKDSEGIELDGSHPLYLYGYGGFNISITPSFSVSRIVFMRHLGGIIAIPNLRGGGEYGETWHQAGCFGNKQNVFDDFQYAAIYLSQQKYTSPEKITICGGSNGGLLVGACINQRPDLFGCAVSQVPVMDMLKFHKFTIGHAWTTDYGSPDKEEDFQWLIKLA
ncbi:Prolyl endopeptidase [Stylophora pistillata]|uniref:Prolyl endopeptidase n=1 Tax=Stylophora pistillata TaxID=50429 RepID=A0A2B4RH04_STYPI|nr:Prolyl endopeptidase [Stylophora pistillata]